MTCRDALKEQFSQYDYALYEQDGLRNFISSVYGGDVLWAYDRLKPYAYKADLGRYCLLHHFGGWYADLSLKVNMVSPLMGDIKLIYFYDHDNGPLGQFIFAQKVYFMPKKITYFG